MLTVKELRFAQKYPFTSIAKQIVKEKNLSLEQVPEQVIKRAALMISFADKNKLYFQEQISESKEILEQEVLAFPIAKILLSLQSNLFLIEKFSFMIGKSTFKYIELEKDRTQTMLDLAKDLEVKFSLAQREDFFVSMDLLEYLKGSFKEEFMKLVNQNLEKGRIYLKGNDFARFLSEIVVEKIFSSMPVDISSIPDSYKEISSQLSQQMHLIQRKEFTETLTGTVDVNAFPPCMTQIYSDLIEGKNVQHLARFDFASFAAAVGMPAEQIIQLYYKTPNFNEKTTRYHVERLVGKKGGKKYSAPSCVKVKIHGLCPNPLICIQESIVHPVQFYKKHYKKGAYNANEDKI